MSLISSGGTKPFVGFGLFYMEEHGFFNIKGWNGVGVCLVFSRRVG